MNFNQPQKELLCQKCDQEYPIWYCDHFIWNPVAAELEKRTGIRIHFLCLNCFAFCCEEIVLADNVDSKIIWKLEIGNQPDAKISFNFS